MGNGSARMLFGMAASCTDGHCGALVRVVVEPEHGTVTHVVIEPEHRVGLGHLVPLELVASAQTTIELRCRTAEFEQLPRSEAIRPVAGIGGYGVGAAPGGYEGSAPGEAMAWPTLGGNATVPETQDRTPAGEVEIHPDEEVAASDGPVGRVEGVIVEAVTGRLSHVLVKEGHVWHRKEVAIPADAVTLLEADRVVLSLTRSEVGALAEGS